MKAIIHFSSAAKCNGVVDIYSVGVWTIGGDWSEQVKDTKVSSGLRRLFANLLLSWLLHEWTAQDA